MIEVGEVLRRYGDAYRLTHRLPLNQLRTMHAIEICRTSALGGHIDECEECGHIRISYNSCRNRHCPKCQFLTKEKWLEARGKELLPIPYFHVVFTVPEPLNPLALRNQRAVYAILFKAASETLMELAQKRLGVRVGVIAVLHTWGQNLMDHPHIHCVVTGGGLTADGWKPSKRRFLLPVKVMSRLFRGKGLSFLKKEKLHFPGTIAPLKETFATFLKDSTQGNGRSIASPPFHGPESVIQYLGRYTHRVALTNHRLISREGGKVSFTWKDYADGNRRKVITLDAGEFIRRFLLHILPHGFMRIRSFGIVSNRHRMACLARCRMLLGVKGVPESAPESWQALLLRLTGIDVLHCPRCNGTMRIRLLSSQGPP